MEQQGAAQAARQRRHAARHLGAVRAARAARGLAARSRLALGRDDRGGAERAFQAVAAAGCAALGPARPALAPAWTPPPPPPPPARSAKQHLPFLQRGGRLPAVCEYVLSGHRLKLHIPKEGVTIAFNPSGVRCPQRGQPAAGGRPAVAEEPYAAEALAFTRERVLQVRGRAGVPVQSAGRLRWAAGRVARGPRHVRTRGHVLAPCRTANLPPRCPHHPTPPPTAARLRGGGAQLRPGGQLPGRAARGQAQPGR